MKCKTLFAGALLVGACLALSSRAYGAASSDDDAGSYRRLATIAVPSGLPGMDISWVDQLTGRYYVADSGSATATPPIAPTIDVVDLRHLAYLYSIPLPSPGHGVLTLRRLARGQDGETVGELWVAETNSKVQVFDLSNPFGAPYTISTGGTKRADEFAYDPIDQIILVANDQDPTPFVTFISAKTRTVLGKLPYPQVVFGGRVHGLEQPVWDGATRRFYLSVPGTVTNPNGEIDEINPRTMKVTRVFPGTTCAPAGLALLPRQRLMDSCGDVFKVSTGKVITTVSGVGADEIWYNSGDDRVYFASGTTLTAVDAQTYAVFAPLTLTTTAGQSTHSVAADSETNRIAVPVSHVGIEIFTDQSTDNDEYE